MALRALSLPTLILATVTLAPSLAHAGGFLEVQVKGGKGAVVCVGDKGDAARYGGAPVINGKATVLLPRESLAATKAAKLYVTASNGKQAGRVALDSSSRQEGVNVTLGKSKAGTCQPSRLIKATAVPGMLTSFAERYREEIMESADNELVTKRFFEEFVGDSKKDMELLMAEAKGMSIIPDARLAVIADAAAKAKSKKEQERRREEIKRWVAAMEQAARERKERVARQKAAKEAEEKAAKEKAKREAELLRIEASKEFCFGGVGEGCGKFQVNASFSWSYGLQFGIDVRKSTCVPNGTGHTCWVNSGSWTHDQCCVDNRDGVLCGGNDTSAACGDEWDRAVRRTVSWFTWSDDFGPTPVTNGVVDFQDHCAPAGQLIEKPESWPGDNDYGFDDRQLCCSKKARDLHWWEAGPLYAAHGLLFYYEPGEVCLPK